MRDLKYIIKKIIIFTCVGILIYLFKANFVSALVVNPTATMNGQTLTTGNFITGQNGSSLIINYEGYPEGIDNPNQYWYVTVVICRDNPYGVGWLSNNYPASTGLNYNNTTLSCSYPNSTYTGGNLTFINYKTTGGGAYNTAGFALYSNGSSSVALIDIVVSADSWASPNDYTNISNINNQTTIINQNNEIKSWLQFNNQSLQAGFDAAAAKQQELINAVTEDFQDSDSNEMKSWLGSFHSDTYGLTDIITIPLTTIESITTTTCSTPLSVPIPFMPSGSNFELPCMTPIYRDTFGSVFTMYQTITTALIGYWCIVRMFAIVKGMKDPEDDKIEVVDL